MLEANVRDDVQLAKEFLRAPPVRARRHRALARGARRRGPHRRTRQGGAAPAGHARWAWRECRCSFWIETVSKDADGRDFLGSCTRWWPTISARRSPGPSAPALLRPRPRHRGISPTKVAKQLSIEMNAVKAVLSAA